MSKFDPYSLSSNKRKELLDEFYFLAASIKTKKQLINFLKDLLTPSEAVMLARRIQVAKMLLRGNDYEEIQRKLRVGTNTITRVRRWLRDGFGDYIKALEKVVKADEAEKRLEAMRDSDPNSLAGLAYKYPLYWALTYELYERFKSQGRNIKK